MDPLFHANAMDACRYLTPKTFKASVNSFMMCPSQGVHLLFGIVVSSRHLCPLSSIIIPSITHTVLMTIQMMINSCLCNFCARNRIMSTPKEEKRKKDTQDNFLHCDLLLKITSLSQLLGSHETHDKHPMSMNIWLLALILLHWVCNNQTKEQHEIVF